MCVGAGAGVVSEVAGGGSVRWFGRGSAGGVECVAEWLVWGRGRWAKRVGAVAVGTAARIGDI